MTAHGARHPLADLDETVHQRARLGILTILNETKEADFTHLKAALGLTDGNLGRHLEVLVRAGRVTLRKGSDGRRSRTWARITAQGCRALRSAGRCVLRWSCSGSYSSSLNAGRGQTSQRW